MGNLGNNWLQCQLTNVRKTTKQMLKNNLSLPSFFFSKFCWKITINLPQMLVETFQTHGDNHTLMNEKQTKKLEKEKRNLHAVSKWP